MNGVSERRNRTLLDMVRSMMSFSKLLISLWGYVLETAARVLNVLPRKSVASILYMRYGKGKIRTSLTIEYGVVMLMLRNMIQIS